MKVNKKSLELIEKGLTAKTVSKLTESQINTLHSRLFTEVTMVSKADTDMINQLKSAKKPFEVYEKELGEEDDFDLDADQSYTGQQGSHDEYQAADDGMDDDTSPENKDRNMVGMTEEDKNDSDDEPNPYAICHSKLGPRRNAKFKSCVKQIKKSLSEGKNPLTLFLEDKIMKLVESHIPPRITKKDLIKYLVEAEPAVAPKPGVKEPKPGTKTPPRIKPSHPGKNPNPGENPAPKAKSPEDAKSSVIDAIVKILKNG